MHYDDEKDLGERRRVFTTYCGILWVFCSFLKPASHLIPQKVDEQ